MLTQRLIEKSIALRIIEPILFVLCLCVISLRATFTEGLNVTSTNLLGSSLDNMYSLIISATLFFSAVIWLIFSLFSRKIIYRYSGIEVGLVIFIAAGVAGVFAASDKRAAITDIATLTAPMFMAVLLVQILAVESRKKILLLVIISLGIVGFSQCAEQFFSSNEMMIEQYEQNPNVQLLSLGIERGSFQHMLYEHRLNSKDVRGFFTTGNSAGAFALLAGFCGLVFFARHCRKLKATRRIGQEFIIISVTFLILVAGLIITRSKGAIIAAMLGAVMFCTYLFWGGWLAKHKKIVITACLCAAITAVAAIVWYGMSNGRLPGGNSMLVRWQYWVGAVKMTADHWLTGVGGGNFADYYTYYKDASALETVRDPHNFLLSILSQYGPAGLLGLLAAIFCPLYRIIFGKKSTLKTHDLEVKSNASAVYYAVIISMVLLIVRPAMMRVELAGQQMSVIIYIVSVLYVLPVVIFYSFFLLMATQNKDIISGNTTIALLFCAIVVLLVHNCIDFAIFEPGMLTTFWAVLACLISIAICQNDEKILKPVIWLRAVLILGVIVLAGVYLAYVLVPIGKTSVKMYKAKVLTIRGDFAGAGALLAVAAEDRFDPAPVAMNGRIKLHSFQQSGRKDHNLLSEAENCLLNAINRSRADFKNFEKLAEVYSELGNVSEPQEREKWLQKEYDSIRQAVLRYPNSGQLRLKLANIAEIIEKRDVAIENYARAIEIEDSYREMFRIMYPGEEIFSRIGEGKYRYAKKRLGALKPEE